jgi:hypothetical protein
VFNATFNNIAVISWRVFIFVNPLKQFFKSQIARITIIKFSV